MPRLFRALLTTSLLISTALPVAAQEAVAPIPLTTQVNQEKAALGKKLYFDTRLSVDGTLSCASCHSLSKGGTDHAPLSTGVKGQKGGVNAPTVFNSAHNFVQFWDGRAADLAAQAQGPVANPVEMGEQWPNVIQKLAQDPAYKAAFAKLYAGKLTQENVADAIAEFEKTLSTPNARFDQFLRGNKKALTAQEQKGYALFEEKGCIACHSGPYFGGNSYQTLNADYFKDRGTALTAGDMGRYNVTKDEADKHAFKVPMLRNVAVTAPYFHDGKVATLEQAVTFMGKYQLGVELTAEEVAALVAFLKTLTGEYQGVPLDQITDAQAQ